MDKTKEIWKELIRLQYQNKSIEDMGIYKSRKVTWEEILSSIYSLHSSKLLDFIEWGEDKYKYYVLVPEFEGMDTFPHKGITINDQNLEGEYLKEYLTTASVFLSNIALATKPLGDMTPEKANIDLIREITRIHKRLEEKSKQEEL